MTEQTFGTHHPTTPINVGVQERQLSIMGGSLLVAFGLIRRDLPGMALSLLGGSLLYQGMTGRNPLYEALDINKAVDGQNKAVSVPHEQGFHVREITNVFRPPQQIYEFWRDFSNFPRVFDFLESVTPTEDYRAHWVAKMPAGMSLEWDTELVNDKAGEVVAWRSLDNAPIPNAGAIRLEPDPAGRGTYVRLEMEYVPPGAQVGKLLLSLFQQEPGQHIKEGMRRFKALMEAGEIPTVEGQPSGRES